MHCTSPEPRHLLQSISEDTRKNWGTLYWTSVFECVLAALSKAPKAGGPFGTLQPRNRVELLEFDLGAGVFQLLLGSFGVGLVHAFLDGLGGAVHQVLGFLEAQAGDF